MTRELLTEAREMALFDDDISDKESDQWLESVKNKEKLLQLKPDDSRWWYTGFAVDRLVKNRQLWLLLLEAFLAKADITPTE